VMVSLAEEPTLEHVEKHVGNADGRCCTTAWFGEGVRLPLCGGCMTTGALCRIISYLIPPESLR